MTDYGPDRWISTWAEVTRAYEEIRGTLERVSQQEAGIALPWFEVLLRLKSAPDQRSRMTDLACSVGFSDSGISRLVDRMENAGLVTRTLSRSDRRATEAVLTDAGASALDKALAVLSPAVERELAGPLSDDEITALAGIMSRLGTTATVSA